jgi:DNA polymerase sigma
MPGNARNSLAMKLPVPTNAKTAKSKRGLRYASYEDAKAARKESNRLWQKHDRQKRKARRLLTEVNP